MIATAADIRALIPEMSLLTLRRKKIKVRVPALDDVQQRRLEAEITRHYTVCGCHQGRATGALTLLVYVILVLTDVIPFHELGLWRVVWYYFLCSFFTMLCGKIYGLGHARISLARLADRLSPNPTPNPP